MHVRSLAATAILANLLLVAAAPPAHAAAAAGIGAAIFPGCTPDVVPVVGVGDNNLLWTFVMGDANLDPECAFADVGVFNDFWDHTRGGCLAGAGFLQGFLCLNSPRNTGPQQWTYRLLLCPTLVIGADCFAGTMVLTVA